MSGGYHLTDAQNELAAYMSEMSERYYCAGWLDGLEYSLWRAVLRGQGEFGFGTLSAAEIAELKRLSDACDGWIAWDPNPRGDGNIYVPMSEWLKMYAGRPVPS